MSTQDLSKANFDQVIENNNIVVVDFWAEWCQPCKNFALTYDKVATQHSDILFAKVDVDAEKELATDFNVRSIPTIMVIRESIVVYNDAGSLSAKVLNDVIQKAKELDMDEVRKGIEDQQD